MGVSEVDSSCVNEREWGVGWLLVSLEGRREGV